MRNTEDNIKRLEEQSEDQARHRSIEKEAMDKLAAITDNMRTVVQNDGMTRNAMRLRELGVADAENPDTYRSSRYGIRKLMDYAESNIKQFKTELRSQLSNCKDDKERKVLRTLTDSVDRVDHTMLFRRVVQEAARMPREAPSDLDSLFRKIKMEGRPTVVYPNFGHIEKAEKIGPGSPYPERDMSFDAEQRAEWGKYGLSLRIPEEIAQQSMYPIMQIYMSLVGDAFKRTKEIEAAAYIDRYSQEFIDNRGSFNVDGSATPGTFTTSGTDESGALNGTLAVSDLFRMYAYGISEGYILDTLLCHPLAWISFAQSPELRSLVYNGVQGGSFFHPASGDPGQYESGPNYGVENDDTAILATTAAPISDKIPVPISIMTSPHLNFQDDARTGDSGAPGYAMPTVDLIMCDRRRIGSVWEDSFGLNMTNTFYDPVIDMTKVQFREYWSRMVESEGKAIIRAKDVKAGEMGFDLESRMQLSIPYSPAPVATSITPNVN